MDPEKQPLLESKEYMRQRRLRSLTTEEVLDYRYDETWRRSRFFLITFFWSLVAISVAIVICLLRTSLPCNVGPELDKEATVSPVHLSLVPLVYNGKEDLAVL